MMVMIMLVPISRGSSSVFIPQGHEKVPSHFEAQKATCHARRHFEQIRHDAFVKPAEAFLSGDYGDGVPDAFVFVAHAGHFVDLESSTQDIAVGVSIEDRTEV